MKFPIKIRLANDKNTEIQNSRTSTSGWKYISEFNHHFNSRLSFFLCQLQLKTCKMTNSADPTLKRALVHSCNLIFSLMIALVIVDIGKKIKVLRNEKWKKNYMGLCIPIIRQILNPFASHFIRHNPPLSLKSVGLHYSKHVVGK